MDYSSPAEVLAAIDALEAAVASRLSALAAGRPAAAAFAASVAGDRRGRLRERARLASRLGVASPSPAAPFAPAEGGLRELRDAQQALVHAHAEGLPALGDAAAVDLLARHLVRLAAQLTVIDLWIEAEDAAG